MEELLAWLTDAQVLLSTKERDPIPEDIKVVEDLYKEHMVRGRCHWEGVTVMVEMCYLNEFGMESRIITTLQEDTICCRFRIINGMCGFS